MEYNVNVVIFMEEFMFTRFLSKLFIKNYNDVKNPEVRTSYGVFGGVLGIICNVILFIVKIVIGFMINSIAIISDAFNNLSDIGSSAVTLIGAKLSSQKPDKEHPFGHGRIEYICSLIVSFIIITMGFELIKSSVAKIINPTAPKFSLVMIIILVLSVFIKLWMYFSMKYLGNKIDSDVLRATSADSLSDVFATLTIIFSVALCRICPPVIDGIAGLLVSVLICITGVKIAWNTINTLLGASPDPELSKKIRDILSSNDEVLGIHDLIIHDYGPGRCLASVHAEVSSEKSAIFLHEIIDELEVRIFEETGVETVIHTDPILVGCERSDEIKGSVKTVIREVNPEFDMHDFRMTDGENRINLIFDLEVPFSLTEQDRKDALIEISKRLKEKDEKFCTVIHVDYKPVH